MPERDPEEFEPEDDPLAEHPDAPEADYLDQHDDEVPAAPPRPDDRCRRARGRRARPGPRRRLRRGRPERRPLTTTATPDRLGVLAATPGYDNPTARSHDTADQGEARMLALIATDGSDAALAAARWCEANLPRTTKFAVASVAPLPDDPSADAGGIEGPLLDADSSDEIERDALALADTSVRATVDVLAPHPVDGRIVRGEAGEALCTLADKLDADVLVVGSHQRGTLTRVFLGSVSDYVVHHSKRPVVVVPLVDGDAEPGS